MKSEPVRKFDAKRRLDDRDQYDSLLQHGGVRGVDGDDELAAAPKRTDDENTTKAWMQEFAASPLPDSSPLDLGIAATLALKQANLVTISEPTK
jgi:hypothetical protein